MIIEKPDTLEVQLEDSSLEFYRIVGQSKEDFYLYIAKELEKMGYESKSHEVLKLI